MIKYEYRKLNPQNSDRFWCFIKIIGIIISYYYKKKIYTFNLLNVIKHSKATPFNLSRIIFKTTFAMEANNMFNPFGSKYFEYHTSLIMFVLFYCFTLF